MGGLLNSIPFRRTIDQSYKAGVLVFRANFLDSGIGPGFATNLFVAVARREGLDAVMQRERRSRFSTMTITEALTVACGLLGSSSGL